jgi:NAD(P)-dependent dehydrogenase (short-subunit alcohol dehydrogenase family)
MMSGRGGAIVNVASLAGVEVFPGAAAYASSKAAVIHFTRVAAAECAQAGNGVRAAVLSPGGVRTPMWKSVPQWRELAGQSEARAWQEVDPTDCFYSAEEVAGHILDLATDLTSSANGRVLVLNRPGRR